MLDELIERINRNYEQVFEQILPSPDEDDFGFQDAYCERARGFYKAANLVVDAIDNNYNLYNAEMIPAALSLYRQAIELHLKSMRYLLAKKVSEEYKFGRGHNLVELWNPIQSYLESIGFPFEDGQLHYRVACFVREFDEIDAFGDRFRYPDSRSPSATNGIRGNFEILKLSASEVDLLSFGFMQLLPDYASSME